MTRTAFLFTGQGAQFVGMGKQFYEEYEIARQTFEEANDVLNFDITKLCFNGSLGTLSRTDNMQMALLTVNVVAYRVYMNEIGIAPDFCAGHSLGEYAALTCSGAMSFSDSLKIIKERGGLSKEFVESDIGAMTIIEGLPADIVEVECNKISSAKQYVAINCYNSPLQVTVAGHKEAVEEIEERVLDLDGRITPLMMSAPFHSPLMQHAAKQLKQYLKTYRFNDFQCQVISNVDALPYKSSEKIADTLADQMVKPVKWQEIMNYLERNGVTTAIEMGPKSILCSLVKENTSQIAAYCFGEKEGRQILHDRFKK